MPTPRLQLDPADAAEIAEALTLLRQWLGGADTEQLAASFTRFIGSQAYPLAELRTDLARFTFLLGYDDGEDLLDTGED